MMTTHHKPSLWPHTVGDSLDPAIRKEDRVLSGYLKDMIVMRPPSSNDYLT